MYEIPNRAADDDNKDDIAYIIEQPDGYNEATLQQKLDGITVQDMYEESYGERGVGWRLDDGKIVIRVVGEDYYQQHHDKEE